MRKIIKDISKSISRTNQYNKDEEEQIEYALRLIIFESLKIIGVIILCTLIGYPRQAIIAVGAMTMVKPYIGGYHEDTQLKCFTATLIIIGSIIYLSLNVSLDFIAKLILSLGSLFCIWQQAPVVNAKMEITRAELIKRNRLLGMTFTIMLILISLVFNRYIVLSNTIVWTILFQALLMFNKRENIN